MKRYPSGATIAPFHPSRSSWGALRATARNPLKFNHSPDRFTQSEFRSALKGVDATKNTAGETATAALRNHLHARNIPQSAAVRDRQRA
jgi:hypothetical protein